MIGEVDTGGALLRRYVPGPALDEPIVWYEGSGTSDRRWLLADPLGSIVAVTNGSGVATTINAYDEYGQGAVGNAGLFGYTGQMNLAATGLMHYRARAYDPSLGRFLQTDPILTAGGINLYAYVGNDPINATDPSGLILVCRRVRIGDRITSRGGKEVVTPQYTTQCFEIGDRDSAGRGPRGGGEGGGGGERGDGGGGGDGGPLDSRPPALRRCQLPELQAQLRGLDVALGLVNQAGNDLIVIGAGTAISGAIGRGSLAGAAFGGEIARAGALTASAAGVGQLVLGLARAGLGDERAAAATAINVAGGYFLRSIPDIFSPVTDQAIGDATSRLLDASDLQSCD